MIKRARPLQKELWQKNACIEFAEMQRLIKIKHRSNLLGVEDFNFFEMVTEPVEVRKQFEAKCFLFHTFLCVLQRSRTYAVLIALLYYAAKNKTIAKLNVFLGLVFSGVIFRIL